MLTLPFIRTSYSLPYVIPSVARYRYYSTVSVPTLFGAFVVGNTGLLGLRDDGTGVIQMGPILTPTWFGKTGAVSLYQRTILQEDGITAFSIAGAMVQVLLAPVLAPIVPQTFTMTNNESFGGPAGQVQVLFQPGDISVVGAAYADYYAEIHIMIAGVMYIVPVIGSDLLRFYAEL